MNVQGLTRPGPSRFFYQFLLGNERATAKEIRDEYVETLSKIYLSYFRSYLGRLMKVQVSRRAEGLEEGRSSPPAGAGAMVELSVVFSSTRRLLRKTI